MAGWIKLHRDILDHWIFEDGKKLKWWVIILLSVNHESKKIPVGNQLLECEPGQSFRSIDTWTGMFKCSKKTTISFFRILEKQEMISCKIVGSGNSRKHLLSVTNWNVYQSLETELCASTTPEIPSQGNPNVTPNKKDKNDKKERSIEKDDFILKIIRTFQESYFDVFQNDYVIMAIGKERSAASKLLQSYKSKYPKSSEQETINGLREYFISCCEIQDDWLRKNMSLSIIVSKFNEINNTIKNGKSKIRSVASRSAEIDAIIDAVWDAKGLK